MDVFHNIAKAEEEGRGHGLDRQKQTVQFSLPLHLSRQLTGCLANSFFALQLFTLENLCYCDDVYSISFAM